MQRFADGASEFVKALSARFLLLGTLLLGSCCACAFAQEPALSLLPLPEPVQVASLLDVPPQNDSSPTNVQDSKKPDNSRATSTGASDKDVTLPSPQPKRILGVMPNFRAVSAGTVPAPPTAKESFIIATKNSFDYSSFLFVGITSLLAEGSNAHPQLGKGVDGFGRYYWRGFVDKADGNYFVIFALPTLLHQDERYYAMGKGGIVKRLVYSVTRILITPTYDGKQTFNASEIFGRGISQGISLAYYPSQTRTFEGIASKYAYALGRDALTNAFREFWPDIAVHVLHRHP